MSRNNLCFNGNDTIDCYPLRHGKIQKILCVSEKTFKAILKNFEAFFKGVRGQLSPRSFNIEPYKGQNPRLKAASATMSPKLAIKSPESFRSYEPSNAMYLQYSDIHRWRRVNEWFDQYAPYGFEE